MVIIGTLDSFIPTNDYVFKRLFGNVGNDEITFYWSKMYISTISKNKNYESLPKCIAILFADFNLSKLKKLSKGHTEWKIKEKNFEK